MQVETNNVLMVDDDQLLTNLVEENLEVLGIRFEAAHSGEDGLSRVRGRRFSLVLLDVTLPQMNGFEVLAHIRQFSAVPVFMLTGRQQPRDLALGFKLGAQDYIAKPFSCEELSMRVSSLLGHTTARRAGPGPAVHSPGWLIRCGETEVDPGCRRVTHRGVPVFLTTAEYEALYLLLQDPGEIRSREEICSAALGRRLNDNDRSVDNLMLSLRRKLMQTDKDGPIQSVRLKGYCFTRS